MIPTTPTLSRCNHRAPRAAIGRRWRQLLARCPRPVISPAQAAEQAKTIKRLAKRIQRTTRVNTNPLQHFNTNNTLFTEAERDYLSHEPREALANARQGAASYNDMTALSSACQKGIVIEQARNIITGFMGIYAEAHHAIEAIKARATVTGQWRAPTLYAVEIKALDWLVWAYCETLKVIAYKEFYRCQAKALSRARTRGDRVYDAITEIATYEGAEA